MPVLTLFAALAGIWLIFTGPIQLVNTLVAFYSNIYVQLYR
jgi:hypothetical protein